MMHGHQTAFFLAPLEHREVYYPQKSKFVLVAQSQLVTHFQTKFTKLLAGFHCIVTTQDQNQVTRFGTKSFFHLLQYLLRIEFVYTRLYVTISLYTSVNHAFGSDLRTFHKLSQRIQLLACIVGCTLGTNTTDVSCIVEYREAISLQDVHQFDKLHAETQVGLVTTIILHGVCPWHALERFCQLNATQFLEQILGHSLEEFDHIVLLHKRHFAVNLCKFRLTVSTQVLVTETFGNLEIAVET